MKIIKKHSKMIPSAQDSHELLAIANISSLITTASTSDPSNANGISFRTVPLDMERDLKHAVSPRIRRIFAMFDQTIFQSTSSLAPLKLPIMLTTNSGADVPNATIVNPITRSDIRSFFASDDAPSTKKSAHLMSMINPITIKI